MSIHLFLSSNSVSSTTISCDSLGIHYEVSKHNGVISVKRWNSSINANVTVGEIQYRKLSSDQIKLGEYMVETGEWQDIKEILIQGSKVSATRSFRGKEGEGYRWKRRRGWLIMCYDNGEEHAKPLVSYHHKILGKEPSYLEIYDSSVMEDLDYIIVTWLYMEKKRRDGQAILTPLFI